jgi:hypothetical protein
VAWAGDCIVQGIVELGEGRLSDKVNETEVLTFRNATLQALDDGHELDIDEIEVGRNELHVIEVQGRRGDPVRRRRTVEERVTVELGPFVVTGTLHRPPSTQPFAALSGWARFVPMTDAVVGLRARDERVHQDVVLVNRERITKAEPVASVVFAGGHAASEAAPQEPSPEA